MIFRRRTAGGAGLRAFTLVRIPVVWREGDAPEAMWRTHELNAHVGLAVLIWFQLDDFTFQIFPGLRIYQN